LAASVLTSVQVAPHITRGEGQVGVVTHDPPAQEPDVQRLLHAPQWLGSVERSTHEPLQRALGALQVGGLSTGGGTTSGEDGTSGKLGRSGKVGTSLSTTASSPASGSGLGPTGSDVPRAEHAAAVTSRRTEYHRM